MTGHATAVRAAVDAWNAHDRDRYVAGYATDAALHGFPPQVVDTESLGDFYAGMWAAVPDARISIEDLIEAADRAAVRLILRGTQEGALMGVPASHRPFEISVMTILRFGTDDRVVERWNTADVLALLQQIGALPAPA